MRESERDKARHSQRELLQNVKEREWRSERVGRPRERVRSHRERKAEQRVDHGWRTLNNRRTNWNGINGRSAERWNARMEEPNNDNSNHGDWVIVSRKRKNKVEDSRGRKQGNSYQRKEKQMTWRNKADVTTFYFSRFPEGIMEKDMWQIFQKWGKVWEVFIPRTKNKLGHRFGFVRFKEVMDEQGLERCLDNNIFIDGQKVFVNRPKFDRGKVPCTHVYGNATRRMEADQQVHKDAQVDKTTSVKKGGPRSYAEVVKELQPGHTRTKYMGEGVHRAVRDNYRPVTLSSNKEKYEWLYKSWVGRLKNRAMFERVEEELKWVVEDNVNPCYWVDDWVLFPNMDDSSAARLIQQEMDNGSTPLSELQKWSPEIRPTHRLTWVLLWGLPLTVWDVESMAKVLMEFDEVVEVDDFVEDRRGWTWRAF